MYKPWDASSSAIAGSVMRPTACRGVNPVAADSARRRRRRRGDALHLGDDARDELVLVGIGRAAVRVIPRDVAVDAEVEAVLQRLGLADVAEVLLPGDHGRLVARLALVAVMIAV